MYSLYIKKFSSYIQNRKLVILKQKSIYNDEKLRVKDLLKTEVLKVNGFKQIHMENKDDKVLKKYFLRQ